MLCAALHWLVRVARLPVLAVTRAIGVARYWDQGERLRTAHAQRIHAHGFTQCFRSVSCVCGWWVIAKRIGYFLECGGAMQ